MATIEKSAKYTKLEKQIERYYAMLQKKRDKDAEKFAMNIRKQVLLYGCPEDDIMVPTANINDQKSENMLAKMAPKALPTRRLTEDTLRGKLWRVVLGVMHLDANDYKNRIEEKECTERIYSKIRGDTKRTFLTSQEYNSRVSEERLVRVLNSFVHRYNKVYVQGMDVIAAGLLYAMPELDAFESFALLVNTHFPLYFHSDKTDKNHLIGAYAGSYLAWDILKICDLKIFNHLKPLPPHAYLFPVVASFQGISQPFTELQKLWDFLFCFGVHLNPIISVAQLIVNAKAILSQNPGKLLAGMLAQRKWMNRQLNASAVIECSMDLITLLKETKYKQLWKEIALHATDFDTAISIKIKHDMLSMSTAEISSSTNHNVKIQINDDDLEEVDVFEEVDEEKIP